MEGSSKYSKYIERAEAHYEQKKSGKPNRRQPASPAGAPLSENQAAQRKERRNLILACSMLGAGALILGIYYGGLMPFG